ncbi:ABC transporter permease, partial [candidate division KSB1 bacterium]
MRKVSNKPPWLLRRILDCFTISEEKRTVVGDIEEYFQEIAEEKGYLLALFWYIVQIIGSLHHFLMHSLFWSTVMLKNYLKTSLRSMKKNPGYFLLNIVGLAAGIAASITIFLWIQFEMSYDRFHENEPNIYRILSFVPEYGYSSYGPGALANYLEQEYPEIENTARIFYDVDRPLTYNDNTFNCKLCGIEQSFLEIFSFPFINGDPETAAANPDFIILTESTAKKFFPDEDPIGKVMNFDWWGRSLSYTVTGVIEDVPDNSHIQFDFFIPFAFVTRSGMRIETWSDSAYRTFVMLDNDVSVSEVNQKIRNVLNEHRDTSNASLSLQPLSSIHLIDPGGGGLITYIYVFASIGILIIIVACINFVNLTTARSLNRAKEVGIRKVVGSSRTTLLKQFLGESVVNSTISVLFALVLVYCMLPYINTILDNTALSLQFSTGLLSFLLFIIITTGLIAGIYPAVVLSSFRPAAVLKGISIRNIGRARMRKLLVIIQFSISVFLIIAALVIYKQVNFVISKDPGYRTEAVVNFEVGGGLFDKFEVVKDRLLQNPNVLAMAQTNFAFNKRFGVSGINWEGKGDDEPASMSIISVDYDFLDLFEIEMDQGRFFSQDFPTDRREGVILNEAAVKEIGFDEPLGKQFSCDLPLDNELNGRIIGVVKDFNYRSLHQTIDPLILAIVPYWYSDIYVKMKAGTHIETLSFIENTIQEMVPDYKGEITFLDKTLEDLYFFEKRILALIRLGTILAVSISILGLFGLASYTIAQRSKEIGIRKILGSTAGGIVTLVVKEFFILILIANLAAWPAAWYVTKIWLENFAFKIPVSIGLFMLAFVFIAIIALLTIIYQAAKAAFTNPANTLR